MIYSRLLIKTFGRDFFRINASFLLATFVLVFSYGFFIKTAGHISDEQAISINLILLLSFIQNPVVTLMISFFWVIYTFKCWKYIGKVSKLEENLFWRYSFTALARAKQFTNWLIFQLFLFLPLILYWILAFIYGLVSHHYLIPVLSGFFLVILTIISAVLYTYRFNYSKFGRGVSSRMKWRVFKFNKPLFSLFLFEIGHQYKFTAFITKAFSLILMIGFFNFLSDIDEPNRAAVIMGIAVALSHSVMAYLEYDFSETHLYFIQQLPYSRFKLFIKMVFTYAILLLPEIGLYSIVFSTAVAFQSIGLSLSGVLFIRCSMYITGLNMRSLLKVSFAWFFVSLVLLLYDFGWYLIAVNLLIAASCFYWNHYKRVSARIK